MKKIKVLFTALLLIVSGSALAQDQYGVGDNIDIPHIPAGSISPDGEANEAFWGGAAHVDITNYWEAPYIEEGDPIREEKDIHTDARLLWSEDTLYIFVEFIREDHGYVFPGSAWEGDHLLIGIDPTHAGDDAEDVNWSGWPQNAPDAGPYVLKINRADGITLNWGDGPDPVAEEWVRGTVFEFENEWEETIYHHWGAELAIYVPGAAQNSQIGFNIAGASSTEGEPGTNAWFAWHPTPEDQESGAYPFDADDFFAGDLQRRGASYGSLTLIQPEQYGTGATLDIPYVAPGTISIDGEADESAWDAAPVISMADGHYAWDGGYLDGYGESPDIDVETRILYTDGALLVHVDVQHYDELYWNPEHSEWGGNTLIVAHDIFHAPGVTDRLVDNNWSGFAHNAPEGPGAYFMNGPRGVTIGWGETDPVAEGFVDAVVFVDEENFRWGVEMAIFSDAFMAGAQVGFNVGGSTALEELTYTEEGEADYAWYSWQTCVQDEVPSEIWCGPGGTILQNTYGYGSLNLTSTVSAEGHAGEVPATHVLNQNYPNPFNPTTHIAYALPGSGDVTLTVYNMLGQQVAVLAEGFRTAGAHSVSWNAIDMPSGMYVYRLSVDGELVGAKKMMLLK